MKNSDEISYKENLNMEIIDTRSKDEILHQKIEEKRLKNRLAAKRSREKKAASMRELEFRARKAASDIQFLVESIYEYDSICGALLIFLENLAYDKKLELNDLEKLLSYFVDVREKGMRNVGFFLNQDMQVNSEKISETIDIFKKTISQYVSSKFDGNQE